MEAMLSATRRLIQKWTGAHPASHIYNLCER
jgi:hypothetical protein